MDGWVGRGAPTTVTGLSNKAKKSRFNYYRCHLSLLSGFAVGNLCVGFDGVCLRFAMYLYSLRSMRALVFFAVPLLFTYSKAYLSDYHDVL